MHIFKINIFYFLIYCCLLHVSNLRVHLQEEVRIYSYVYGIVLFTCIGISRLLGRGVFSIEQDNKLRSDIAVRNYVHNKICSRKTLKRKLGI
jgi:hypothetical protein